MKIKCLCVGKLLAPYFTPGIEYRASRGDDDTIVCHSDDKDTVIDDGISWCFWQMPNGRITAFQNDNSSIFEVSDE